MEARAGERARPGGGGRGVVGGCGDWWQEQRGGDQDWDVGLGFEERECGEGRGHVGDVLEVRVTGVPRRMRRLISLRPRLAGANRGRGGRARCGRRIDSASLRRARDCAADSAERGEPVGVAGAVWGEEVAGVRRNSAARVLVAAAGGRDLIEEGVLGVGRGLVVERGGIVAGVVGEPGGAGGLVSA